MDSMKKYLAEFIGTFVLVLLACGTAVMADHAYNSGVGHILIALAFGLAIIAMAYTIGHISGCHINPAVSLAMTVNGKLSFSDFCGYVAAQIGGAFFATAVMLILFGRSEGFGANNLFGGDIVKSLIVEFALTFVFVLTVMSVTSKKEYSSVSGLVIGMALTLVHIFGIFFTGTSVNPARSLAPAVLSGGDALKNVWVFIVGPFAGALMAALVHMYFTEEEKPAEELEEIPAAQE